MKKILLLSSVILSVAMFQFPVLANNNTPEWQSINNWSDLVNIFQQDSVLSPLALQPNITIAPTRQENGIMNIHPGISLDMQGSIISGDINYATLMPGFMFFNSANNLTIKNGKMTSNDTTSAYMAMTNNGEVSFTNVNVIGGIQQMQTSAAGTTSILAAGSGVSNTVTLSGPNSFTAGDINFTGTGSSTLIFDGGSINDNVTLNVTGTNNTLS